MNDDALRYNGRMFNAESLTTVGPIVGFNVLAGDPLFMESDEEQINFDHAAQQFLSRK